MDDQQQQEPQPDQRAPVSQQQVQSRVVIQPQHNVEETKEEQ